MSDEHSTLMMDENINIRTFSASIERAEYDTRHHGKVCNKTFSSSNSDKVGDWDTSFAANDDNELFDSDETSSTCTEYITSSSGSLESSDSDVSSMSSVSVSTDKCDSSSENSDSSEVSSLSLGFDDSSEPSSISDNEESASDVTSHHTLVLDSSDDDEEHVQNVKKKQRVNPPPRTGNVESLTNMTMQNVMETTDNMSGSRRRLKSQKELYVLLVAESMVDNAINNVLESLGMSPPGIRRIVNAGIASAIQEQGLCLTSDGTTEEELNDDDDEAGLSSACPHRANMCHQLLNNVSKITLHKKLESNSSYKDDKVRCIDIKPQPSTSSEMPESKISSQSNNPTSDPKGKRLKNGKKRKFHVHHQEPIPGKRLKIVAIEERSSSTFKTETCLKLHDIKITAVNSSSSNKGSHNVNKSDESTSDKTENEKTVEGPFDSCLQEVEDEALLCAISERGIFM